MTQIVAPAPRESNLVRFTYYYKTSDGQRHQDEVHASSKDEAYSVLIKRGIRPIKVFESLASRPSGPNLAVLLSVIVALAAVCGYLGFSYMRLKRNAESAEFDRYSQAYTNLVAETRQALEKKDAYIEGLDLSRVRNYALIEELTDVSALEDKLIRAALNIGYTRGFIQSLFRDIYELLPEDRPNEIDEAKSFYSSVMESLDAQEATIARDLQALRFLVSHRNGWKVKSGGLVFSSPELELEFSRYSPEAPSVPSRWTIDFARENFSGPIDGS